MGVFPVGATLIPNPVNQVPGFSLSNLHFVPGFPAMAWPMIEWVLDTHYSHLRQAEPLVERTVIALEAREGDLIDLMQQFVARYPTLKFSSLPSFGTEQIAKMHIEFGLALAEFCAALKARDYSLIP
jgi:molybdopterin-biosynthesis enzyme MoeA-like protein